MKKILCIVLSVLMMAAVFVGCGNTDLTASKYAPVYKFVTIDYPPVHRPDRHAEDCSYDRNQEIVRIVRTAG